jgi:hypothetical protein
MTRPILLLAETVTPCKGATGSARAGCFVAFPHIAGRCTLPPKLKSHKPRVTNILQHMAVPGRTPTRFPLPARGWCFAPNGSLDRPGPAQCSTTGSGVIIYSRRPLILPAGRPCIKPGREVSIIGWGEPETVNVIKRSIYYSQTDRLRSKEPRTSVRAAIRW